MPSRVIEWTGRDDEGNVVSGQVPVEVAPAGTVLSGAVSLPELTVAAGETCVLDPRVSTTVEITAGSVVVEGTLVARPDPGVTHTIRLVGIDEAAFLGSDGGGTPATDRGVWVQHGGRLDFAGAPKTAFSRSIGALAPGATTIQLASPVTGWQAGDDILVAPTQMGHASNVYHDVVALQAVSPDGLTLTVAPLIKDHPTCTLPDGAVATAHVGNLTRSVRVEGTPTGRAHVLITHPHDGVEDMSHVAFRWMGPTRGHPTETYLVGGVRKPRPVGVLGRYPLHVHHGGDATRGATMTGLVVRDSGHHAYVPHASHGITLRDCISHDVRDEPFWWDQPAFQSTDTTHDSLDVTYDGCWASETRSHPGDPGYSLSAFLLNRGSGEDRNTGRALRCVATGTRGSSKAAGFFWGEINPAAMWEMLDCEAYANAVNGAFVWQNGDKPHLVDGFRAWRNGEYGVDGGAYRNAYRWRRVVAGGNQVADFGKHAASGLSYIPDVKTEIDVRVGTFRVMQHSLPAGVQGLVTGQIGALDIAESPSKKHDLVLFQGTGLTRDRVTVTSIHPLSVFEFTGPTPEETFTIRGS